MISQPHTPDIDDIIIAYHTYVTEDGTYSQEFEVSRDEVVRALAAAEQRGAERGWDEGYAASDEESYYFSTHGCTPNPYRADQLGAQDA